MDPESQYHILLQLSNLELYVALFGLVIGGWVALSMNDMARKDRRTLFLLRLSAGLIGVISILMVIWLAAALALRFAFMIGMD